MKKLAMITITSLTTLAFLFLAWQLMGVVAILVIAIVLATTVNSFVTLVEEWGWSRRLATVIVILAALLFAGGFLGIAIYVLGDRLPLALQDFRTMYGELRSAFLAGNRAQQNIATRLPQPALLDDLLLGADGSGLLVLASDLSRNFGPLASNVVLVIFVTIYWVADRERIERLWLSLLAPTKRLYARNLLYEIEGGIGTHLRSQIVQSVIAIVLLIGGYIVIGLKYPFLLGLLATILWFVPLIGSTLALIPAFLLGLINGYGIALGVVLYTVIIFAGVRTFTNRIPALRQKPGSMLELIIAIALIDVLGIIGLALTAPVTIAIQLLLKSWFLTTTVAPTVSAQLELQSIMDNLTVIGNRVADGNAEISPRTRNLYKRLVELVEAIKVSQSHSSPS